MNNWKELINDLNELGEVRAKTLYKEPFTVEMKTMDDYIWLLKECGFIKFVYKPSPYSLNVPVYNTYLKLIKKIPEKLTIKDAEKIKRYPWLAWFKQFE